MRVISGEHCTWQLASSSRCLVLVTSRRFPNSNSRGNRMGTNKVHLGRPGGQTMDSLPMASTNASAAPQYQEFILFGSVKEEHVGILVERLKGLCDPSWIRFESEHEMIFSLKAQDKNYMNLRIRRTTVSEPGEDTWWHFCYVGVPDAELSRTCPSIVRRRVDSKVASSDMMGFLKELGFRMQYEFIAKGWVFTKGLLKITVSQINKTETVGSTSGAKPLTGSRLVEVSSVIRQGTQDPLVVSKALKDFSEQLKPIVHMEKVDYMKD